MIHCVPSVVLSSRKLLHFSFTRLIQFLLHRVSKEKPGDSGEVAARWSWTFTPSRQDIIQ